MSLGKVLAALRAERQLTQLDVAKELHISNSCVSAYETGARQPSITTLRQFMDFYQVSSDDLLEHVPESAASPLLSEEFAQGVSLGELLELLRGLSPDQKDAVLLIVRSLSADAAKKTERNGDGRP